ncbi:acyl-CoA dehydrogenase family protein [Thermus filiformis]|uniref:Acyl-CoA dehydrogenase n=1 Tax=Thermus filiformis TaxID=276 RepID=A0A0A2WMD4_THEFI|nr:acyl-CoA dehydrogenase family protein [Thermus filiformis]KGQ20973.1 acyl-CoA dehydrogenase [Thermus filiformis]
MLKTEARDLLARAKAWAEEAEREAFEADRNARFSQELIRRYHREGFHRLLRPKRYGGAGLGPRDFMEFVRTVAYHNVAAAWLAYFYPIHEAWVAFLPPKGRKEIFQSDELVVDVFTPLGKVEPEGEGFRLSGEWKFASGVLYAQWIGLGAMVPLEGGPPQPCLMAVRVDEVEIVENWDTLGLRPTGSHGIRAEGVYVPPERILPLIPVVSTGKPIGGEYDEDEPLYRVPFMPMFLMGFPALALGGAERLVEMFAERTRNRARIYQLGAREAENVSGIHAMGEIHLKLETLRALYERYANQLEAWVAEGYSVATDEERERMFALRAAVTKGAADLATQVLTTLGGTAVYKGDKVELFVRDLLTVACHTTLLYEDALQGYGKALLGLGGHPLW